MFKLVIVDDEYLIRELIRHSVQWQDINIEIVGQAEDGHEAIDLVEKFKPDIVLIDINIPFINGIDLAQGLRDKYPELRIVILTGYGEFAFAQKAIGIGVYAYLLKPLDASQLQNTMMRITQELTESRHQQLYINELKLSSHQYHLSEQNKFLNSLIHTRANNESKILKHAEKYKIKYNKDEKYIITIQISKLSILYSEKSEQHLWAYAVSNITQEILSSQDTCIVFVTDEYKVVSIISIDYQSLESIYDTCGTIINSIKKYTNLECNIAISNVFTKCNMIYQEYMRTIEGLDQRFYTGTSVINCSKMQKINKNHPQLILDKEKLILAFEIGDAELINNEIDKLVDWVIANRVEREIVNMKVIEWISTVLNVSLQEDELKETIKQHYEKAKSEIIQNETVFELKNTVKFYFDNLLGLMDAKTESKVARMVGEAQQYIKNNYSRYTLALEEIASNIYISPNYLSKIFKKECNQTVVECITEYRMQKAIELIGLYPNIQVNILAQKTGFSDPFYFSRLFKKKFGISPSKYIDYKMSK